MVGWFSIISAICLFKDGIAFFQHSSLESSTFVRCVHYVLTRRSLLIHYAFPHSPFRCYDFFSFRFFCIQSYYCFSLVWNDFFSLFPSQEWLCVFILLQPLLSVKRGAAVWGYLLVYISQLPLYPLTFSSCYFSRSRHKAACSRCTAYFIHFSRKKKTYFYYNAWKSPPYGLYCVSFILSLEIASPNQMPSIEAVHSALQRLELF